MYKLYALREARESNGRNWTSSLSAILSPVWRTCNYPWFLFITYIPSMLSERTKACYWRTTLSLPAFQIYCNCIQNSVISFRQLVFGRKQWSSKKLSQLSTWRTHLLTTAWCDWTFMISTTSQLIIPKELTVLCWQPKEIHDRAHRATS